jgi:hypothetical protein
MDGPSGSDVSDFAIHPMAEILGEADALLSRMALRATAFGGASKMRP